MTFKGTLMVRLIVYLFSAIVLYIILKGLLKGISPSRKSFDRRTEPEELVQDPSCETYIPRRLAIKKTVGGIDHYFCSKDCLEKYLRGARSRTG